MIYGVSDKRDGCQVAGTGKAVTCGVKKLKKGGTATVEIRVLPTKPQTITNQAKISADKTGVVTLTEQTIVKADDPSPVDNKAGEPSGGEGSGNNPQPGSGDTATNSGGQPSGDASGKTDGGDTPGAATGIPSGGSDGNAQPAEGQGGDTQNTGDANSSGDANATPTDTGSTDTGNTAQPENGTAGGQESGGPPQSSRRTAEASR